MIITAHLSCYGGGGAVDFLFKKCLFLYISNDNRTARFVGSIDSNHEQSQYVNNYIIEKSDKLSKICHACKYVD